MSNGKVIGIYIAEKRGVATVPVDHAHLIPGKGINGDRYFDYCNNPDIDKKTGREITLIESEAIETMWIIDGVQIQPDQTRRNIITSGISLNDLVDRIFYIGNIKLRGVRLCEPCQYLADRTDQRILNSMVHKGGLRAEIILEGIIHIGDIITTPE
jgi:MOSC domain-containing protein YiiM